MSRRKSKKRPARTRAHGEQDKQGALISRREFLQLLSQLGIGLIILVLDKNWDHISGPARTIDTTPPSVVTGLTAVVIN